MREQIHGPHPPVAYICVPVCSVEVSGMRGGGGMRRAVSFNFEGDCENSLMAYLSQGS